MIFRLLFFFCYYLTIGASVGVAKTPKQPQGRRDESSLLPASLVRRSVEAERRQQEVGVPTTFLWEQQGADLTDGREGGEAGRAVAISADGTRVVVGAAGDLGSGGELSGWVQVYDWNTETQQWMPLGAPLVEGTNQGSDRWGETVALSADGTILAVAAPFRRSQTGFVRLFWHNTTTSMWTQLGQDLRLGDDSQLQGISVDLSANGQVVIIGDAQDVGNSLLLNTQGGRVRVYSLAIENEDFSTAIWSPLGNNLDGDAIFSSAGRAVAVSADGLVVAVAGQNRPLFVTLVRVYALRDGQWVQRGADIDGHARTRIFEALALSMDGSIVAVGDPNSDADFADDEGRVRVFGYDVGNNTWIQRGFDLLGEQDDEYFGSVLDLSADGLVLAVGSPQADNPDLASSGQVRIYRFADNTWHLISQVVEGEIRFARLGEALALSADDGSVVAIGEPNTRGVGSVQVFVQTDQTPAPTLSMQPTLAPTAQPTFARPAPRPAFCFAGESTVQVQHNTEDEYQSGIDTMTTIKMMHELEIGDRILVGKDTYEPVYSFGHKLPWAYHSDFLKITFTEPNGGRQHLTITPDHIVFVESEGRAIPASQVRVGQRVQVVATAEKDKGSEHADGWGLVSEIMMVAATGLYAPFTPSGTLVVNGIRVSAFTSLQGTEMVHVWGFSTGLTHHWLDRILVLPHRIYCFDWGLCDQRDDEVYIDGISQWLHRPHQLYVWWCSQNYAVQTVVAFPVVIWVMVWASVDTFMHGSFAVAMVPVALAITLYFTLWCYQKRRTKSIL